MATATFEASERSTRRPIWAVAAAFVALFLAAAAVVAAMHHGSSPRRPPAAFSWLTPAAAPAHWHVARTPSGAALSYPSNWTTITTDPGTASAAPRGERGAFVGYLNATPQSGRETLANWSRFRVAHVASEGARDVQLEATAANLRFRDGTGSCVIDRYTTEATQFREIACIVAGSHGTAVVVAAAPAAHFAQQQQLLERGVASFEA